MKYVKRSNKNLTVKALSLAAITGLTLVGMQANAESQIASSVGIRSNLSGQNELSLSNNNLTQGGMLTGAAADITPTLTELHNAGTIIPGSDPETVYPMSGYTLTPVESTSSGNNVVNIPQYDETSQTLQDSYYQLDLTKTQYGNLTDGDRDITCTTKAPGNYDINVKVKTKYGNQNNPASSTLHADVLGGYDITYKYNNVYGDSNADTTVNLHVNALSGMDYNVKFNTNYGVGDTTWTSDPTTILGNDYTITAKYNSADVISPIVNNGTRESIEGAFVNNTTSGIENNYNDIGTITANFINNSASSHGGGISNGSQATIDIITGNFINNSTYGGLGGGVSNSGLITTISGNFVNNFALDLGGGVYNGSFNDNDEKKIVNIYGNFVNNTAGISGGGIANEGIITNITGDFINNIANECGGGIANNGTITSIVGTFINNSAPSGGGVNNDSSINAIRGDFINNSASSGGGINNGVISRNSKINTITGNFINNSASHFGGGIFNYGKIDTITGNFINNSANSHGGGGIGNDGTISTITANFINNLALNGGGIYNNDTIDTITGDFINNSAARYGGGIYNGYLIDAITGDFINNSSSSDGGGIFNFETINTITGNFINNSANSHGGGIYNNYEIGTITGDFINNSVTNSTSSYGGGIYNDGTITSIYGNFINNSANSHGGGIYNNYEIGTITGDFINNSVTNSTSSYGGGIYNDGTITSIYGDFINNLALNGGGIYNNATIDTITGDFINNSSRLSGGGIYNISIIDKIVGDFIDNCSQESGGAIYNSDTVGTIIGDFTNNWNVGSGGGIDNEGSITLITSNFIDNLSEDSGGGICNDENATITSITGNFISNAVSVGWYIHRVSGGGGISNMGNIERITGDFISNYSPTFGGGIYNDDYGTITSITGNFINNNSSAGGGIVNRRRGVIDSIKGNFVNNSAHYGGAIYNSGVISSLTGDFINNRTKSSQYKFNYVYDAKDYKGGAIYNDYESSISKMLENSSSSEYPYGYPSLEYFVADWEYLSPDEMLHDLYPQYSSFEEVAESQGYTPSIGNITFTGESTFSGNTANGKPNGIYNKGIITIAQDATVTLNDGWQSSDTAQLIMEDGATLNLNIGNGVLQDDSLGNVTNAGTMNATVDFSIADKVADTISVASVTQEGKITLNNLNFINGVNTDIPQDMKGQEFIVQILKTPEDTLQLDLSDNVKNQLGDADYEVGRESHNLDDVVQADTNWKDEYHHKTQDDVYLGKLGLATTDTTNDSIGITLDRMITEDVVDHGKLGDTLALVNQADIESRSFNFDTAEDKYKVEEDLGQSAAGTLTINGKSAGDNKSTVDFDNHNGFIITEDTDLVFNDVKLENAGQLVVSTNKDSSIELNNVELKNNENGITTAGNVKVTGNSDIGSEIVITESDSAIELDASDSVIKINNKLSGVSGSKLYINNGTVDVNSSVTNLDTTLSNTTLNMREEGLLNNNNLTVAQNSTINFVNNQIGTMALNNVILDNTLNVNVDVDLATKLMDKITGNSFSGNGYIDVKSMNLLSDAKQDITRVMFTNDALKNNVRSDIRTVQYSPIYRYGVEYDPRDGHFVFTRGLTDGGSSGNEPESYNPAVLTTPVATQAAGQATIHQTFQYVFEHADSFMQLPSLDRFAKIHNNQYSLSTDYNNNLGEIDVSKMNKAIWVRPFTSFDKTDLENGPKVNSVNYGTLVGGDTEFRKLKNGWANVGTGYIGYFGSQVDFKNVDTSMNGGLLGLTETFYKGNFFTALTASVGAGVAESHTMYGKDDITMLMAGIASKTGYNFEFKEGKFIIQPILMVDYTMINTFDYTNSAGVKIEAKPMHTIQLNPTVRFIGNLKNGWQPYASIGMVWNLMNQTNVSANGVDLPRMHTKPYVEYGVGLQRNWNERFSAFGQAMVRNGGRTGIAFTAGFRWALGKDESKSRSVDASVIKDRNHQELNANNTNNKVSNSVKTVIKTQKLSQKSRNLARYQAFISDTIQ